MGIMLLLIFSFSVRKCPFLCDSRPTTSVTRGNTHCCGPHWWAAKVSIFPLFVLVLGNLLLATTCASIVGDMVISSAQETHAEHLHVDNNTPWHPAFWNSSAMHRPMPCAPPVTMTILSLKSIFISIR